MTAAAIAPPAIAPTIEAMAGAAGGKRSPCPTDRRSHPGGMCQLRLSNPRPQFRVPYSHSCRQRPHAVAARICLGRETGTKVCDGAHEVFRISVPPLKVAKRRGLRTGSSARRASDAERYRRRKGVIVAASLVPSFGASQRRRFAAHKQAA